MPTPLNAGPLNPRQSFTDPVDAAPPLIAAAPAALAPAQAARIAHFIRSFFIGILAFNTYMSIFLPRMLLPIDIAINGASYEKLFLHSCILGITTLFFKHFSINLANQFLPQFNNRATNIMFSILIIKNTIQPFLPSLTRYF